MENKELGCLLSRATDELYILLLSTDLFLVSARLVSDFS